MFGQILLSQSSLLRNILIRHFVDGADQHDTSLSGAFEVGGLHSEAAATVSLYVLCVSTHRAEHKEGKSCS